MQALSPQMVVALAGKLTPAEFMVATVIAVHGPEPCLGMRHIRDLTGMSLATVQRTVAAIERKGAIVIERQPGALHHYRFPVFQGVSQCETPRRPGVSPRAGRKSQSLETPSPSSNPVGFLEEDTREREVSRRCAPSSAPAPADSDRAERQAEAKRERDAIRRAKRKNHIVTLRRKARRDLGGADLVEALAMLDRREQAIETGAWWEKSPQAHADRCAYEALARRPRLTKTEATAFYQAERGRGPNSAFVEMMRRQGWQGRALETGAAPYAAAGALLDRLAAGRVRA